MRTRNIFQLLLFALAATFLLSDATAQESEPWTRWQTTLQKDHPLAGKIWSVREKRFITPQTLGQAVNAARYLLIGEVHDNRDHHRLQAWLIEQAAAGRKPAVVMEMIASDKAPDLRAYLATPDANPEGLGAAIDWEARGWPEWKMYQPIAEAAMRLKLPIRAGDIDKPTLRSISKKGLGALDIKRRKTLILDTPLGEPMKIDLLDELFESHCKLVPRGTLGPMFNVQRLRDAVLADSLIEAAGDGSAILITGNGHARADRAVPWYLTRRAPQAKIVTVLLLEVEGQAKTPEDLAPLTPDGVPAADYLWFSPRAEREDQCEALRKRFGK
jgi:uncharacterized iron-regulated protein